MPQFPANDPPRQAHDLEDFAPEDQSTLPSKTHPPITAPVDPGQWRFQPLTDLPLDCGHRYPLVWLGECGRVDDLNQVLFAPNALQVGCARGYS